MEFEFFSGPKMNRYERSKHFFDIVVVRMGNDGNFLFCLDFASNGQNWLPLKP